MAGGRAGGGKGGGKRLEVFVPFPAVLFEFASHFPAVTGQLDFAGYPAAAAAAVHPARSSIVQVLGAEILCCTGWITTYDRWYIYMK